MDVSETRPRPDAGLPRPLGCLAAGCPCRDARIVSHRRARFFHHLAIASGETADRVIVPDPDWQLPGAGDADSSL